uniref:SFRICE_018041 n=1 Tax=Spodoptera frugiperda TaxID=7108 RepID=A0A2H1VVH8_SPOFR
MSLTKLLKAPIKLFKKEVITFLIVRRYDLGVLEESLRYIAVRPSASISVLRQKVWHLLDLPDFCEEVIVLKANNEMLPLTELRRGNTPQNPFVLEVWLPNHDNRLKSSTTVHNNMLTIGNGEEQSQYTSRNKNDTMVYENTLKEHDDKFCTGTCFCDSDWPARINQTVHRPASYATNFSLSCIETHKTASTDPHAQSTISDETMAFNKVRISANKQATNTLLSDFKKSDMSCRISSTSLFKLNRGKSRDNFTNILLKIQSDLSTLSNKLSVLETKLPA